MRGNLIVINSDAVNRKHMVFTVGALEGAAFDNAISGIPALVGHDGLRPIGWNFPFGLYFQPHLTRLIANYQLAETAQDYETIRKAYNAAVSRRYHDECAPHRAELEDLIGQHQTSEGRYAGLGCAAFVDDGILNRAYPHLSSKLDKDGLISVDDLLAEFEYLGQGLFKDRKRNIAVFCHRFFRRSLAYINNFNFEFLDQFMSLSRESALNLRIALDNDVIGLASSYHMRDELEWCWGPHYSDDIGSIKEGVTTYKCDETQMFFSRVSGMQFWWKNEGGLKTLEAEELRDEATNGQTSDQYGCRYIHSIYHANTERFQHFDGAIRMYSTDEMVERIGKEMNKAGKQAHYTKLFRIDGKLPIPTWKLLITYYYQGNPLTYEYFGLKQEYEKLLHSPTPVNQSIVDRYMPYKIEKEDGLRLFVSYHKPSSVTENFDRLVINPDYTLTSHGKQHAIEFHALEIKKALTRLGQNLTIPDGMQFISVKDDFINFPTILHSSQNLHQKLQATLDAYKLVFDQLSQRDVTVSMTLAWPLEEKEVRLSIFGKASQLANWLTDNPKIPVEYAPFRKWIVQQSAWLRTNYQPNDGGPKISDLLSPDGVLFTRRRQVEQDWIRFNESEKGLTFELRFPKDATDLYNAVDRHELRPALYFVVEKAKCSKTGEDYFLSATSKVLDADVVAVITEAGTPSAFWTHGEPERLTDK